MKNSYCLLLCMLTLIISTSLSAQCVNDNEAPLITGCPSDINACDGSVTWAEPVATDNCRIASFTNNYQPGAIFPLGTATVTYTAVDVNGNTSACSFNVTTH